MGVLQRIFNSAPTSKFVNFTKLIIHCTTCVGFAGSGNILWSHDWPPVIKKRCQKYFWNKWNYLPRCPGWCTRPETSPYWTGERVVAPFVHRKRSNVTIVRRQNPLQPTITKTIFSQKKSTKSETEVNEKRGIIVLLALYVFK